MLKLENSIRGLSFSRVAFDLTIHDINKRRGCNRMRFYRILVAVPLKYKKYQEN